MPTAGHLPRWRGFNLAGQAPFYENRPIPFDVWDFDFMAEHGFNFTRLAVDYRRWTPSPGAFVESGIAEVDRAIGWARERKIHVNLDLHAAPGHTSYTRPQVTTLWEDGAAAEEFRRQFTDIWRVLARRYKGIPSTELSFNLVNEPSGVVTPAAYLRVAEPPVAAIRTEDPSRLIIADGIRWAQLPVPELTRLGVAQSRHMYAPTQLTSYKAGAVAGSDKWPVPTWPLLPPVNAFLVGNLQDFQAPLVLRGDFPAGAEVRITVDRVARRADLAVRADGKPILQKQFTPGPGTGEWKSSTFRPQSNDYEATYDRPYSATLASAARELTFELTAGNLLAFSEIRVRPLARGELSLRPSSEEWRVRQTTYVVDASGTATSTTGRPLDKEDLWRTEIAPWKDLATSGVGVHVGEFGAYNETPYDVVLRWMADVLELFRRADFGWALWLLRGKWGPVDSERRDVRYEDYKGHKLDRAMLELLKAG